MILLEHENLFVLECLVSENSIPKRAGFTYDPKHRVWLTPFASVAAKIKQYIEPTELIDQKISYEAYKSKASKATYSSDSYPLASGSLFAFQKAGISYILQTNRCLIADEMGLGKTIQAITVCNVVKPRNVLIVCPASLKINWAREWDKFSTLEIKPSIINYDILKKHSVAIHSEEYDVLILDECHYLKNSKAQRTKEIIGEKMPRRRGQWIIPPIRAHRVMALTGTPILNRPEEIYTLLNYLLPTGFPDSFKFGKRYCNGHHNGFGWDFSGSSNLAELQQKLRSTIMLRRLKKDVLLELPNKIRQVIEFDIYRGKKILKKEKKLFAFLDALSKPDLTEEEFRRVVSTLETPKAPGFEELSKARKEVAELKLPMCIDHLKELLASTTKVVCFCHHIDTARGIQEAFGKEAVMLIGGMTDRRKQKAVDSFQNDSSVKLFIGNIKAAGVGLTLTAASTVVFVESDWVPGNMSQCEDRCHRIGQKNSVLVQHLVLAQSLDAYMARKIILKQQIIERAVDESALSDDIRELLK